MFQHIQKIAASIASDTERTKVLRLANEDFETAILSSRLSPLDILEAHPTAALPLSAFLAMLPPMRIRQYSISSSPLIDATTASLTWAVLDTPAASTTLSTDGERTPKRFLGVASNYLSNLEEGDRVHVAVKPSHGTFHPPADIEHTPTIMLCAGTGLAPFRGFLAERSAQLSAGRTLAPAHLFIGCTSSTLDRLFATELDAWAAAGVVSLYYAFSREPEKSGGARYVQERLWLEREKMAGVFEEGAMVYICGSAKVGEGVGEVVRRIYGQMARERGKEKTEAEVEEWFEGIRGVRYASDVFV